MKNQYLYFLGIISLFFLVDFTTLSTHHTVKYLDCFSLLWNDGMNKKSWIFLNQEESNYYLKNTDISEGDLLGMPINSWDAIYTDAESKKKFSTANKTNASVKLVTYGYKVTDQKKAVGFDFNILNKDNKNNSPYIFRISNNSQKESNSTLGKVREVGFVYDNWPQYWGADNKWLGGYHSFKENYDINNLDKIIVKFKYRLDSYNTPLNKKKIKEKWLGSYVTCDFRFNEYDDKGNIINKYLIGVIFSNPLQVDYNDNPNDDILYGSGVTKPNEQQILLLHGNKVGVKEINTINPDNKFEIVEFDFKPLINKYLSVNKNKKNFITGLDIYSATRGTNITYDIQDIHLTGCKIK